MKKKIIIGIICLIFLANMFTTSAVSIKMSNDKDSNNFTTKNKWDEPIETILITEQVNERTWIIKVYAYNPHDEAVTITTGSVSANTKIENEKGQDVFSRTGPSNNWFIWYLPEILKYRWKHTIPSHEQILLDEFTFHGKSSLTIPQFLYFIFVEKTIIPRTLPEDNYGIFARIVYKYEGNVKSTYSEDKFITLGPT